MLGLVLEERVGHSEGRRALLLQVAFWTIAVDHPDLRGLAGVVFLGVDVVPGELDPPIEGLGVVGQVLYHVLDVAGRVRVAVLAQLGVLRALEGGWVRTLELEVEGRRLVGGGGVEDLD